MSERLQHPGVFDKEMGSFSKLMAGSTFSAPMKMQNSTTTTQRGGNFIFSFFHFSCNNIL
jgi:hypothetical protein